MIGIYSCCFWSPVGFFFKAWASVQNVFTLAFWAVSQTEACSLNFPVDEVWVYVEFLLLFFFLTLFLQLWWLMLTTEFFFCLFQINNKYKICLCASSFFPRKDLQDTKSNWMLYQSVLWHRTVRWFFQILSVGQEPGMGRICVCANVCHFIHNEFKAQKLLWK